MSFSTQASKVFRLRFEPLEDRLPPAVQVVPALNSILTIDPGVHDEHIVRLPFELNYFGQKLDRLMIDQAGVLASASTETFNPISELRQATTAMFAGLTNLQLDDYQVAIEQPTANQISFTFTSETLTKPGATRGGTQAVDTQGEISITFTNRSDISTGDFDVTYGYRNLSYFGVDEQSIHRAGFASGDGSWLGTYELLGSGQLGAFDDDNLLFGLESNQFQSSTLGEYRFEVRSGTMLNLAGTAGQSVEVAPGTVYLGSGVAPRYLKATTNVAAADTVNADELQPGAISGLNLDGSGVRIGIWDGGRVRLTHQEFGGRVVAGTDTSGNSSHATHVAGTIGASGVSATAKGMAIAANITSWDFNNDSPEMSVAASAASNPVILSNHSYSFQTGWIGNNNWGGTVGTQPTWVGDRAISATESLWFGIYDVEARDLDQILFANQNYLSVWAASNERGNAYSDNGGADYVAYFSTAPSPGTSAGSGWYQVLTANYTAPGSDGDGGTGYDSLPISQSAKNNLVVGAINDITADPYTSTNVSLASFSSFGPTDDGRVRPDVVANGVSLTSSTSASDTSYGASSGTSMAAPNVTGSMALLIQHYRNLFINTPRAATSRGLVAHTAFDVSAAASGTTVGPDYRTGWGVLDARAAANFLSAAATPSTTVLANVRELTYSGVVQEFQYLADGESPFKATISWTDPAGTPKTALDDRTPVLVNDLDLSVIAPDGTVFYPWVLNPNSPASGATTPATGNHIDNIEQVTFTPTQAGIYRVRIGHTGTITNSTQNFSLLVSGSADQRLASVNKFQVVLSNGTKRDVTSFFTGQNIIVPWQNVSAFELEFNKAGVVVDTADLTLTNQLGNPITSTLTSSGFDKTTVRWTFGTIINSPTRLTFALDGDGLADGNDGVRDVLGQFMQGGDFNRTIGILPGDSNRDGVVNSQDMVSVRNRIGQAVTGSNIFADLNGDGVINMDDMLIVRARLGQQL